MQAGQVAEGGRPAQAPLVSIVILSYQSRAYLEGCLASVAQLRYEPLEVIVVDNASRDGSAEVARRVAAQLGLNVQLLALADNRGCAGGNNAGWRASHGELVVFLNPDTEVTPDFVTVLVDAMGRDARLGVAGAKMYYPGTRTLQHAGGVVHPNGMTQHVGCGEEDTGQYDTPRECDYVTGAGFAVPRQLLEQLGGFDEDYFPAYFEEVDLCTRARRAGWRVLYVPQALLYHHESVSLEKESPAFLRLYQRMRIRYCLKNFSLGQWRRGFVPFEYRWMRHEPAARGHRRQQLRAYLEAVPWMVKKLLRG